MVCYARRATGILSIAIVALFLYGADTAHLFDVVGLLMSIAIVLGGAAAAAGAVFVGLRSVRRKRALAGGCVSCQLRCQHAMTDGAGHPGQRMWLVRTAERPMPASMPVLGAGAGRPGSGPGRAVPGRPVPGRPVIVPVPRVPVLVPVPRVPAERVRVSAEGVPVRVPVSADRGLGQVAAERGRGQERSAARAGAGVAEQVQAERGLGRERLAARAGAGVEFGAMGDAPRWPDRPARRQLGAPGTSAPSVTSVPPVA
jgi:hypothetical protein